MAFCQALSCPIKVETFPYFQRVWQELGTYLSLLSVHLSTFKVLG